MKTVLSRYSIDDEPLNVVPPVDGAPTLFSGFDLISDASILIKVWPRRSGIDSDLLLLWEAEIRQMQHIAGLPGVTEYLIPMHDAGVDDEGFYLILGNGDLRPLDWQQQQLTKRRQLSMLHTVRKLDWSNLRRIAHGLGILHSQGLIHRNVSESTIFTEYGNVPDFRLGGFEWNIRLNAFGDEVLATIVEAGSDRRASFRQDWQAFAQLALRLLGIPLKALAVSPSHDADTVAQRLKFSEQNLLRKLIHPVSNDRPDTELVLKLIDQIISEYNTSLPRDKLMLYLTYNHQTMGRRLVQLLLDDHMEHCDVTDAGAVTDFICQDLFDAELLELHQEHQSDHRFAVVGQNYIYFLNDHVQYGWQFPQISKISRNIPSVKAIRFRKVPPRNTVVVRTPRKLADELLDLRIVADHWDVVSEETQINTESKAHLKFSHDAYLWLFIIEGLQLAAEAWTVEVVDIQEGGHGKYTYSIRFLEDDQRRRLSNALNLKLPLDRFIERLDTPDDETESNWCAIQQGNPFRNREPHEIVFDEFLEDRDGEERFRFSGSVQWNVNEKLLLRTSGNAGDSKSMRRRKKLIAQLADHDELLTVLNSPLITARKSHNEKPVFDSVLLDDPKQRALMEMIDVLPMYVLQGPPGTGKTHLVSQLVKHIVSSNRSPRLLISAQGHDPINNLMVKITNDLEQAGEGDPPLMVRSKGRKGEQVEGPAQLKQQGTRLMDRAIGSLLFQKAPGTLQLKLRELGVSLQKSRAGDQFPDKALESLIFRSANIVFSTTNSSELEEMVDMSAHFDWSIVEEAGRATGVELLAPLMLSHRRLLIGDPKQLPSFGEDQIKRLLKDPASLYEALVEGRSLLDGSFNDIPLDDLLEKFREPTFAARMVREVHKHLTLFASLHNELYNQRGELPLAGRLTQQYRMRPEIAEIVSKVFYDNGLETPENAPICEAQRPFQITNAKRLPQSSIVIVDMPYWHSQGGAWARDNAPAHHNPGEIKIVLKVLSLIRCSNNVEKPAKLAVLTPYNQQVKRLKHAIAAKDNAELKHLKHFSTDTEMVQTIDSFQGKEADIVVVSLVRNNPHSRKKALGILADSRRMNVLLSRAKFKLVIVGSLNFLELRFLEGKSVEKDDELYFIYDWLNVIKEKSDESTKKRSISIIPPSQLSS